MTRDEINLLDSWHSAAIRGISFWLVVNYHKTGYRDTFSFKKTIKLNQPLNNPNEHHQTKQGQFPGSFCREFSSQEVHGLCAAGQMFLGLVDQGKAELEDGD